MRVRALVIGSLCLLATGCGAIPRNAGQAGQRHGPPSQTPFTADYPYSVPTRPPNLPMPPPAPSQVAVQPSEKISFPHDPCPQGIPASDVAATPPLAAGWNLVGASEGSCILAPEQTVYLAGIYHYDLLWVPPYTRLPGDFAYWIYAPRGGSLQQTEDLQWAQTPAHFLSVEPFSVEAPGGWVAVPNDSNNRRATVQGGQQLLVYVPGVGYQPATDLGPGQAGFVVPTNPPGVPIRLLPEP